MFSKIEIAMEHVTDTLGDKYWLAVLTSPARQGSLGRMRASGRTREGALFKLMEEVRILEKLKFGLRPADESGKDGGQNAEPSS